METQRVPRKIANAVEDAERQRKAVLLRTRGLSYRQIAREAGYAGPGNAYRAVMSALRAIVREPAEELLTLELARLDTMLAALWGGVLDGNPGAVNAALRVEERRARLLGLDQPLKIDLRALVELAARWNLTDDERRDLFAALGTHLAATAAGATG